MLASKTVIANKKLRWSTILYRYKQKDFWPRLRCKIDIYQRFVIANPSCLPSLHSRFDVTKADRTVFELVPNLPGNQTTVQLDLQPTKHQKQRGFDDPRIERRTRFGLAQTNAFTLESKWKH